MRNYLDFEKNILWRRFCEDFIEIHLKVNQSVFLPLKMIFVVCLGIQKYRYVKDERYLTISNLNVIFLLRIFIAFHFLKEKGKGFHVSLEFFLFLKSLKVHGGLFLLLNFGLILLSAFFIGIILGKKLHDSLFGSKLSNEVSHDEVFNIDISL